MHCLDIHLKTTEAYAFCQTLTVDQRQPVYSFIACCWTSYMDYYIVVSFTTCWDKQLLQDESINPWITVVLIQPSIKVTCLLPLTWWCAINIFCHRGWSLHPPLMEVEQRTHPVHINKIHSYGKTQCCYLFPWFTSNKWFFLTECLFFLKKIILIIKTCS